MPISRKQKQIMAFPFTNYDAIVCDGAIRSGKTVFMMLSFVDDAMRRYNNQRFGICGKTVDSTVKNLIMPYIGNNQYFIRPLPLYAVLILCIGQADIWHYEVLNGTVNCLSANAKPLIVVSAHCIVNK